MAYAVWMRGCICVLLVVLVAGCGGSTAKGGTDSAQARLGRAAGESLVCVFSQVPYPAPVILAQDFESWVSGKTTAAGANFGYAKPCPAPPVRRLSAPARFAAARVVLQWAATVPVARWGPGAIAYLKTNGVNTSPIRVPRVGS